MPDSSPRSAGSTWVSEAHGAEDRSSPGVWEALALYRNVVDRGKGNSEGKEMYREYRDSGGELKTSQFKIRMKSKGYEYKKVSVCGQKVYGYMGISCGADDEFDDPE